MAAPTLPLTHPLSLGRELWSITHPGYIQASGRYKAGSEHFEGMFFARDAIQVVFDIGAYYQALMAKTIFQIASFQGTEFNPVSEEEPGRIHHQLVSTGLGVASATPGTLTTMRGLAREWGYVKTAKQAEALTELLYYGAVDTTPQFVRMVAMYCRLTGNKRILEADFRHYKAGVRTVRAAVVEAAEWLMRRRTSSGFIAFKATNPKGILNQYLRDSDVSTLHPDGSAINYGFEGVAGLDVQCAFYDALGDLAYLLGGKQAKRFLAVRQELQESFVANFWLGDKLAMALDHDESGKLRAVATASNIQAEVLDCGILDGLPQQYKITKTVLSQMFGPAFWTSVGLRTLTSETTGPEYPYPAYQSSHTVWNVLTGIAARGCDRAGLYPLARKLDTQMLAAADAAGGSYEAYYVDINGKVAFDVTDHPEADRERIIGTNVFCLGQAFTVSTLIRARWAQLHPSLTGIAREGWQQKLCQQLLAQLPDEPIHAFKAWVDKPAGRRAEQKLRRKLGLISKH